MWGSEVTRHHLRQTICHLSELNNIPELPTEHVLVTQPVSFHRLDIAREREIASNLAFLLATTDNSLKVMAVCVEEQRNGRGSIIRISSNTGDLSEITQSFTVLAGILEQAARRGQSVLGDFKV